MTDSVPDANQAQSRVIEQIVELQREFYFENKGKDTERRRRLRDIIERATSGANTIGTRCVGTLRAPRRRMVRRAASLPMDSGESKSMSLRAPLHQPSRCIWPLASMASGAAETPA